MRRVSGLVVVAVAAVSEALVAGGHSEIDRALLSAARSGDVVTARRVLLQGATPDVRDRAAGTALDVAEQAGHHSLALLLRQHGARGSGKSVGSRVCVRPWKGSGFCGTVAAVERSSYLVEVTSVVGCDGGCPAEAECSSGREVGGTSADAVRAGTSVRTRSWCLTHTGLE